MLRSPRADSGQATVEYALIVGALLCVAAALAALWRALESGLFAQHTLMAASHHVTLTTLGAVADVFSF